MMPKNLAIVFIFNLLLFVSFRSAQPFFFAMTRNTMPPGGTTAPTIGGAGIVLLFSVVT